MSIVTRFAPSPTGYLHLGHAYAALFAWHAARSRGGRFLLRIEDIDQTRCRPAFMHAILEDLAWLGIDVDGPVRVQSEHMSDYRTALDRLADRGLTYPCFCSRTDIAREVAASVSAPHAPDGSLIYPGTCRTLPAPAAAERMAGGERYVIRLDVTRAVAQLREPLSFQEERQGRIPCDPAAFGDVVLARKDTPVSYHLCVTHDDALQGVTLVTRGADLRPATDIHRLLQVLMGWPEPHYAHHRLLTDASGRRFAKRDGSLSLRELRASGRDPVEVIRMAGFSAAE